MFVDFNKSVRTLEYQVCVPLCKRNYIIAIHKLYSFIMKEDPPARPLLADLYSNFVFCSLDYCHWIHWITVTRNFQPSAHWWIMSRDSKFLNTNLWVQAGGIFSYLVYKLIRLGHRGILDRMYIEFTQNHQVYLFMMDVDPPRGPFDLFVLKLHFTRCCVNLELIPCRCTKYDNLSPGISVMDGLYPLIRSLLYP